jgi:PhzF family phenazine biosynthesis protein
MRIPLFHLDAFTSQPLGGHPAAGCPLQARLDDALLHKVAAENTLSETAFIALQDDRYALPWFTPRSEVRLYGRATRRPT